MDDKFISEPIKPVEGTFDTAGMTRGEPGLPGRFVWRNKEYTVAEVLEKWKESGRSAFNMHSKDTTPPERSIHTASLY